MYIIIGIVFLFACGAICGWILELFFRRFVSQKHWVNPGFLNGPYLPLYGFSTVMLYWISQLQIALWLQIIIFLAVPTLFELITGLVFIHFFNIRLWDYSNQPLNFKGVICPIFSIIWGGLGILFKQFAYPVLYDRLDYLVRHPELSFFVGTFLGIIILDAINSFDVANQIRKKITETGHRFQVNYEKLKLEVRLWTREHTNRNMYNRFMTPFNGKARGGLVHSIEKQLDGILQKNPVLKRLQEKVLLERRRKGDKE